MYNSASSFSALNLGGSGAFVVQNALGLRGTGSIGPAVTIQSGGTLTIDGSTAYGFSTQTFNADINNAGNLVFNSDNISYNATLTLGAGKTLTNTGTITLGGNVSGGDIIYGNVTNTGTINIAIDDLNINNATLFNAVGGTISTTTGRTLTVTGGSTRFGTGTSLTGSGTVDLTGNHTLDIGSGYTHLATSTATLKFGGIVTVNGTGSFVNQSTLSLRSSDDIFNVAVINAVGASLIIDGSTSHGFSTQTFNADVTNAGTLTFSSDNISFNAALTLASGKTLTNTGTMTLSGNTSGGDIINGNVTNTGTINVTVDDLTINNATLFDTSSGTISTNSLRVLTINGGTTRFGSGTSLPGAGTVDLTGTHELNIGSGYTHRITHTSTLKFGGTVTVNGSGAFVNEGTLSLRSADDTFNVAFINAAGASLIIDGSTASSGSSTQTFNADVTNAGTLTFNSDNISFHATLTLASGKNLTNTGTITLSGNTSGGDIINGNVTNTGTINVTVDDLAINNATLFDTSGGTVNTDSSRTLTVNGGTTRFGSGTSLPGVGTVDLTGTHELNIGSGYTHRITHTSTLKFGGVVDVNGSGAFVNEGTLSLRSADDTFNVAFINAAGASLIIDGSTSHGFSTQTFNADVTNAGTLTFNSDNISFNATLTLATGKTLANTGTVTLSGSTSGGDTINGNITNTGTINVTVDDLVINSESLFNTVGGTLSASTGRILTVNGGTSRFGSGTVMTGSGTVDLTGVHTLDIGTGYTHQTTSTATLKFGGTVTVTGTGTFVNAGTLYLRSTNDVFNVNFSNLAGANLYIDATTSYGASTQTFNADLTNAGTLTLSSDNISFNAALVMGTGKTLTNTGTLTQGGSTSGTKSITGTVINTGAINVLVDDLTVNGALTSGGTITMASGKNFSLQGASNHITLQSSSILQGAGTLSIASSGGSNQDGTIQPGNAGTAGLLTISHSASALAFGDTSVLNLDLGGISVGTQYDKLVISGSVVLNGTININLINSFVPSGGQSFTVMSYSSASQSVDRINGLNVGSGVVLDPAFSATSLVLSARTVTFAGDSNANVAAGTAGQDVMLGGDGSDTLTANGNDLLFGEGGNDVIELNNLNFNFVDGGAGIDTLKVADLNLDMTTVSGYRWTGFEVIDLQAGSGSHVLRLTSSYLSQVIPSGTELRIMGDGSDTVHIGTGWTLTPNATTIDGEVYNRYTQGGTSLLVDTNLVTALDPIVLDLNGDGVQLVDLDLGIRFDMGLTGVGQATGWVGPEDALLALDRNHDGVIQDATELFSERMFAGAAFSGMEALSLLDENDDHIFDFQDIAYSDVLVWQDKNQDGFSDKGEMLSLAQRGIVSVSLDTVGDGEWKGSNQILTEGHFAFADGRSGELQEVAFYYRPVEVSASPAQEDGAAVMPAQNAGTVIEEWPPQVDQLDDPVVFEQRLTDLLNALAQNEFQESVPREAFGFMDRMDWQKGNEWPTGYSDLVDQANILLPEDLLPGNADVAGTEGVIW
ncbi:MAG TPA: hypothetical protein HPQ00_17210, partial [Magnetococcales bacterium]|nr:hypothetical protein [Magnetococcales bacterium]